MRAATTATCALWQVGAAGRACSSLWHVLTQARACCRRSCSSNDRQAAFFFGEPLKIFGRIWHWFVGNADIYRHLWVTLLETVLAFGIGTVLGLGFGLWLALAPMAARDPRPVHQGAELDAARDPGADLRGVVRPGHLRARWRSA